MAIDLKTLLMAARDTVQFPRQGARAVIDMGLPATIGWMALGLMAVVSAALAALMFAAFPTVPVDASPQILAMEQILANPLQLAVAQGIILIIGALLIYRIGRIFGGAGQLADTVVLLAWLEFILLMLQILQTAAMVVSPPMSQAIGLLGFVIFLWLLSNFVAELHGFSSVLTTFMGIVGSIIAVSFAAAVVLALVLGGRMT